jgi:phasin family protein
MSKKATSLPDFSEMFRQFSAPGFDMDALMAAQRRNFEAITEANQIAARGMIEVVKRQNEILQDSMSEWQENLQRAMSGKLEFDSEQQSDQLRDAIEHAVANMRELAELSGKHQSESFAVMYRLVQDNMAEITELLGQARSGATSAEGDKARPKTGGAKKKKD